jgi:hypothetical protein
MKKTLIVVAAIGIPVLLLFFWWMGVKNREVGIRNEFNAKITERTAIYDNKVFKTIAQKAQITLKADSSFYRVVDAVMAARKDADGLFMKWVTESNPAATWTSVQELYKDLSRTVESVRTEFVEMEKKLQDIKLQHDDLRLKFPSSIVVGGVAELPYKPITSDRTDDVIRTGKDNNTSVF